MVYLFAFVMGEVVGFLFAALCLAAQNKRGSVKWMNAKEYMKQADKLDRLINNKIEEANALLYKAQGVSSVTPGERVQSAGDGKQMERRIAAYVELQNEINADINRYIALKREIVATIEQLDGAAYDLLHKIYLQDKTLAEVAHDHNRSYSWAVATHCRALASLQKILEKNEKKLK